MFVYMSMRFFLCSSEVEKNKGLKIWIFSVCLFHAYFISSKKLGCNTTMKFIEHFMRFIWIKKGWLFTKGFFLFVSHTIWKKTNILMPNWTLCTLCFYVYIFIGFLLMGNNSLNLKNFKISLLKKDKYVFFSKIIIEKYL